ncbi:hypothetical protein DSL72_004261 [Monilinia vaccinii-corymbosi]|uniref:Phytanoyl-CoA dioxygenase n=1 Tax=Monilinia vaccinii-corymbosi TaxID=61207 RepID=A0A8A3P1R0_9HELO|nr:hypothetical protein DSL72_004261 [Monilinia vaccinii-corymbosi]
MSKPKSELLESLERDGFVLIPALLSQTEIDTLRLEAKSAIDLARSGSWPHVRTLPKQFPPWNVDAEAPAKYGIWGVQSLMHPRLPSSPSFIKLYFSDKMLGVVKDLLQCEDDDLVMELFNLLISPDRDFELRWHRDDIPSSATAEEELARLSEPAWHAQWNMALYDDASLIVVPRSHKRARTDAEREMGKYETGVEGEIRVEMRAGDVVFYDNNILHRAKYESSKERATLHGSVGHKKGKRLRARNVLQHGLREWVSEINLDVLDKEERRRANAMRERLLKLAEENGEVGYSLVG